MIRHNVVNVKELGLKFDLCTNWHRSDTRLSEIISNKYVFILCYSQKVHAKSPRI